jgi:RES domain-containing protein
MEWHGTAYRAVATQYANKRDLLSGQGTKHFGGRWTPPGGFATVHASLSIQTAVAESLGTQQHYGLDVDARLPLTLVAIAVRLQRLVDLTDESVLVELQLTRRQLTQCRWREALVHGREALTQAIGRTAFEAGIEGLLVPSAQSRNARNLVVFPDNLERAGSIAIKNVEKLPKTPTK